MRCVDPVLVFLLSVPISLGAIAIFIQYFSNAEVVRRGLRGARLYRIRAFPPDKVARIAGTVRRSGELLEAPVTGRRCIAYVVRLREESGGTGVTHPAIEETRGNPFLVEDTEGRALVKLERERCSLTLERHKEVGVVESTSGIDALLARQSVHKGGGRFRFEEGILEEGDRIAVLGKGRFEPDPEGEGASPQGYRTRAMRLILEPTRNGRLFVSDDPSTYG
jgi:hypothetical protein